MTNNRAERQGSRPVYWCRPRSPGARTKAPPRPVSTIRPKQRRARTLEKTQIDRLLAYVAVTSPSPEADRLKIVLSFYAGLRACEIATLDLDAVTDASGRIGRSIGIRAEHAKNGRPRIIPMHPMIRDALVAFRERYPGQRALGISARYGTPKTQSANSVSVWFRRLYRAAGLEGCSSHSGRRTFITNLARRANTFHNSLRDVQQLAGHARLETTESYIEPSADTAALVASLGADAA